MRLVRFLILAAPAMCAYAAGGSPLFTAIRDNNLTAVQRLASQPGAVNAKGDRDTTPLLYASAFGSPEAVKVLLDAGADANAANGFGATSLMLCVTEPAKIRLLLSHGADVNAKSKTGRTPLILAALHNGSEDVVEMLLAKGADAKAADKDGFTFLHAAAAGGNAKEVRLALAKGIDVNATDKSGATALLLSASVGDVESVRMLLAKGADANAVNTADSGGKVKNGSIALGKFTPLLLASSYGPPAVVELLLRAGAKVNAQDIRGMTPLHYAVTTEAQDPAIVRLLLKAGADPSIKMSTGESATEWAGRFGVPEVTRLLPSSVADIRMAPGPASPGGSPRAAATRSMQLLEKVSAGFMNTGGCFACHAQNLTAVAASYAKAHGVPVNQELQQGQLAGDRAFFSGSGDQFMLRYDGPGSPDILLYTLLHFSAAGQKSDPAVDPLLHNIIALQSANGSWHRGGFARPPLEDSDIITTSLAIRAIRQFAWPGRKAEMDAHAEAGHAWLKHATPVYNEEQVMQLMGLKWAGETNDQLAPLARRLIALQREDGGWAQNSHLTSDSYATGQSLTALAEAGMPPTSPVYRRGVQYLLRTQHADGSWYVKSRAPKFQPYFQSGFPYDHDQWISMAGTAWATAALSIAADAPEQVATAR